MICITGRDSINIGNMKQRLRNILSQRQKRHIVDASLVPSAVLLPLYHKQGQYYILLTKRTDKVREHKGQISFPGGVYEEGDETLLGTALRECAEEIGLKAEDAEVLGALDDEVSVTTNYVISPFVALIPWPYHFQVNEDEIEEIIEVPISALRDRDYSHQEIKTPDGKEVPSDSYQYQGKVIWGATARILNRFLDIFSQAEHNP